MDQQILYLKARFPDAKATTEACSKLRPMLDELVALNHAMQLARRVEGKTCVQRRAELKARFPLAWRFVDEQTMRDVDERLAKEADPFDKNDPDLNCVVDGVPDLTENYQLGDGDHLYLSCQVWSWTTWEPIVSRLLADGAQAAGWISESDIDPFVMIDLEKK